MAARITPEMGDDQVIGALAGSDSAAWNVCFEVLRLNPVIDPYDVTRGLDSLKCLDSLGIYDTRIVILCNEVCENNVSVLLAVLRANQMGLEMASRGDIDVAIDHGIQLDLDSILKEVRQLLPNFYPRR